MKQSVPIDAKRIWLSAFIPLLFIVLTWLIKSVEYLFDWDFSRLGVFPLNAKGLFGILFSPLIHGSFDHLLSNTLPLLVLGTMLFYFYPKPALKVFLLLYFVTGIWVWFGARPAYHIGSSGIIYGLASFIFMSGVMIKSIQLLAMSLLVVFLYGGLIWGLFPIDLKISWESHLSGFVLGIILAVFYKNENRYLQKVPEWMNEEDDDVSGSDEVPYWKNEDTTNIS
jgi:membrane associated rhomboid family serine protease